MCISSSPSPITVWAFPSVFKSGATGCHWENPLSTLRDDGFMAFSITPLFHPPLWAMTRKGTSYHTRQLYESLSACAAVIKSVYCFFKMGWVRASDGKLVNRVSLKSKKVHSAPVASLDALLVWLIIWGENPHSFREFSTWESGHKSPK